MSKCTTLYRGRLIPHKPAKSKPTKAKSEAVTVVTPAAIRANSILAQSNRALVFGAVIGLAIIAGAGFLLWQLAKG